MRAQDEVADGLPTRVDTYTHGHAEPVLQSHRWRTAENSAAYLLPSLRPGLDLLDVGCGPGTITVDLAARVAPGRVRGPRRLGRPARRGAGRGRARPASTVTFEVGDVYALEAADDSFDVVHAHQVLQHLTDPVAALREMARVCRPGGVIAVRDVDYARASPGSRRTRASTAGWTCTTGSRGATAPSRTPDAGCCRGRTRPGCGTSRRRRAPGASPRPTSASGGARSWAGRATASSFAEQARGLRAGDRRRSSRRSPPRGCAGRGRRRLARHAARRAAHPRLTTLAMCADGPFRARNCASAHTIAAVSALAGGVGLDGGAHVLRQPGRHRLVGGGEPLVLDVHPAEAGVHLGRAVVEVSG